MALCMDPTTRRYNDCLCVWSTNVNHPLWLIKDMLASQNVCRGQDKVLTDRILNIMLEGC